LLVHLNESVDKRYHTSQTFGHVQWFNKKRDYGVIRVDQSGETIFVHSTEVRQLTPAAESKSTLLFENNRVKFGVGYDDAKQRKIAIDVFLVSSSTVKEDALAIQKLTMAETKVRCYFFLLLIDTLSPFMSDVLFDASQAALPVCRGVYHDSRCNKREGFIVSISCQGQ
jgi:cold shock CspA family protein